nr:DJ-1/PfpI family protein [Deinobacterium chartae]
MNVAVLVFAGVSELDLGTLLGLFGRAGERTTEPQGPRLLEVYTLARSRASVQGTAGLVLTPQYALAAAPDPQLIVVPGGSGAERAARDPQLRAYLSQHAGKDLAAIGGGALLLGEAGLLADQVVTARGGLAERLWSYQPAEVRGDLEVVHAPGRHFAQSGLAGVRLTLDLIAQQLGEEAALEVARSVGAAWAGLTD